MIRLPLKTYNDIIDLGPCYDPVPRGYCTAEWEGTALDVLHAGHVPPADRLWVALSEDWIPERIMYEFALWCPAQIPNVSKPDRRSINAMRVMRLWLDGQATSTDMLAAEREAWVAASSTDIYPDKGLALSVAWALSGKRPWTAAWKSSSFAAAANVRVAASLPEFPYPWSKARHAQVAHLISLLS